MSGAGDRLARLLALVPWLRAHPGVAVADAAAIFGVSERQLRDDLALLWCCGLPGGSPGDLIDLAFDGPTVTVLDAQTLDRPLRLTVAEAQALLVAARALADLPGLRERAALDSARAKLEAALGGTAVDVGTAVVALEPQEGALAVFRAAVEQGRRVHLRYLVESRDESTERDVDPLRVALVNGRVYLEGYCYRAQAVRLFRADRVEAVHLLAVAADPPAEAVPRDLAEGVFAPSASDAQVVIDLGPGARWVADYYPCERVDERPDGTATVTLRTPDVGWVVSLGLRLGGQGRVRSPAGLAARIEQAARAALAAYRQ